MRQKAPAPFGGRPDSRTGLRWAAWPENHSDLRGPPCRYDCPGDHGASELGGQTPRLQKKPRRSFRNGGAGWRSSTACPQAVGHPHKRPSGEKEIPV